MTPDAPRTDPVEWAPLLERLTEAGQTVAAAESLTGGRLTSRLTDAPGASAVVHGGIVSYATEVKLSVLRVPDALVEDHGVVSAECARAMAEGVRALMGTTYGLSTTGVAGPDRQEGKPVGTVFVAVAGPDGTSVVPLTLDGERDRIQERTVDAVLSELAARMDASDAAPDGRGAEDPVLR